MENFIIKSSSPMESSPYVVTISNPTNKPVQGIIFGFNHNYCVPNFGNHKKVEIKNLMGGTYHSLLAQSSSKPFRIGKWLIYANGPKNPSFFQFKLITTDANGESCTNPIRFFINPMQFQSNIFESEQEVIVDGNVMFEIELAPKTTYTLTMFPSETISITRMLNRVLDIIKTPFRNVDEFGEDELKVEHESLSNDSRFNPKKAAALKKTTLWQRASRFLFGWMWKKQKLKIQAVGDPGTIGEELGPKLNNAHLLFK